MTQPLQVHCRGKKIEGDVDWELIARGCAGWTGADIAVSCWAAHTCTARGVAVTDAWEGEGGDDERQVLYTPESVGQLSLARSGMTKNLLRRGLIPPDTESEPKGTAFHSPTERFPVSSHEE